MKRYTDQELLVLLEDLESDAVGRKQSFKGEPPTKARQAVCAFANDVPNCKQPDVRVAVDIVSAPTEIRRYDYPIPALQQLTRNAVMHRSYEGTNAPVMVYWFNDHIEIINAGGPYGRVTPENFGKPGFADYRNPDIAESMKVLNLVQRFGVGI